jgi:hypothetical protein
VYLEEAARALMRATPDVAEAGLARAIHVLAQLPPADRVLEECDRERLLRLQAAIRAVDALTQNGTRILNEWSEMITPPEMTAYGPGASSRAAGPPGRVLAEG